MHVEFKNELNALLTEVELLRDRFGRLCSLVKEADYPKAEEVARMAHHLDELIDHIDEFFWSELEDKQ